MVDSPTLAALRRQHQAGVELLHRVRFGSPSWNRVNGKLVTLQNIITDLAADEYVIGTYDKVAKIIADVGEDPAAAEIVRRAVRIFVAERTIPFNYAMAALFGRATTHRERADVARAGKWLRELAEMIQETEAKEAR